MRIQLHDRGFSNRRWAGCSSPRHRAACAPWRWASSDAELARALSREFPAATLAADAGALAGSASADRRASCRARSRGSICRSTCRPPRFSGRYGRRSPPFPTAKRAPTARSRHAIGRPRAVRAVARACATNPVALAIPCHRVVPAAGGTGGYRWGAARKKALLSTERRPDMARSRECRRRSGRRTGPTRSRTRGVPRTGRRAGCSRLASARPQPAQPGPRPLTIRAGVSASLSRPPARPTSHG